MMYCLALVSPVAKSNMGRRRKGVGEVGCITMQLVDNELARNQERSRLPAVNYCTYRVRERERYLG